MYFRITGLYDVSWNCNIVNSIMQVTLKPIFRAIRCFLLESGSNYIVPSRSYQILKYLNTGNYSMGMNFKRDVPKMDIFEISKSIFSYIFWAINFKNIRIICDLFDFN